MVQSSTEWATVEHPLEIGGYPVLRLVGHGGMGTVYQVQDPKGGPPQALKLLRQSANVRPLDRLRFDREFRIISQLHHPSLVRVFELGECNGRPFFTMEFVQGQNLRLHLNGASAQDHLPWPERLSRIRACFEALLSGLEYIHQHHIVHRDLKPENVVIDEQGQARLLDFGLARGGSEWTDSADKRLTEPGMVIGTIHYMSPEQITGSELDSRSDLYSLGVMLYEMLTGRLPFDGPEPMTVLFQILHQPPPPLRALGPIHPELEAVVLQLLCKEPTGRPRKAKDILQQWARFFEFLPAEVAAQQAVSTQMKPSLPSGTPELYAAQLVGREQELRDLESGLSTLEQHSWLGLLEGSAGIGKSRLIQAVTSYARSSRLNVLNCQAFEASRIPYQLWLRALRWSSDAAVHPELLPFRRALSVLIPEAYSDQQLPAAEDSHPANDPVQRYHLFEGMARLLSRQIRERRSCLLVLEDLHWADPASLEFLLYFVQTRWAQEAEHLPLCLLLSWREEETQGKSEFNGLRHLISDLHGSVIKLEPLSEEDTGKMLLSMLGGPLEPSTVAKVHLETEGNPLFITELTRTLVSEGRLVPREGNFTLDTTALPRTSLGGSRIPANMREAIMRRLVGLSADALEVLHLCAVLGSKVDFELLALSTGLSERHLLEMVFILVQRKLLVEKRDFYFPNQSTLDIILETIKIEELRILYRKVAQGLEKLFQRPVSPLRGTEGGGPVSPLRGTEGGGPEAVRQSVSPARVRQLAHFCQLIGDFPRAAQQLLVAAQQARQAYAFEDANQLLEQLVSLPEDSYPVPPRQIQELWADAIYGAGRSEEALDKYSWMLESLPQEQQGEERVRLLRKVGTCWERLGHMQQAHEALRGALEILEVHLVAGGRAKGMGRTLGILGRNVLQNMQSEDLWKAREAHWVCERLSRVMYMLRPKAWIQDYLNLIIIQFKVAWVLRGKDESSKASPLAQALLVGGYFTLRGLKWTKVAQSSLIMAAQKAEDLGDGPQKASLLRDCGYVLLLSGSPSRARRLLEQSLHVSNRIGDEHGLAVNHLQLQALYTYLGFVGRAQEEVEKALTSAIRTGSHTDQALAVSDLAAIQAIRGLLPEARASLTRAEEMRTRCRATYVDLLFGRAHCYVAFFERQLETAQQLADHLFLRHCENGELPFHLVHFGVLSLSAQAERLRLGGSFDRHGYNEKLHELRKLAKGYRVYLKILDRLEAQVLYYQGKRSKALERLAECAAWAERENNPLEAARTHFCLAKMLQEEGLGEHHHKESMREFKRAGVILPIE